MARHVRHGGQGSAQARSEHPNPFIDRVSLLEAINAADAALNAQLAKESGSQQAHPRRLRK